LKISRSYKYLINIIGENICDILVILANSAGLYLTKFRFILRCAVEEEILSRNPADKVKVKTKKTEKRFLTADELIRLEKEFKVENISAAAFLFAVYTGARLSDIKTLKFDNIQTVITEGDDIVHVWDFQMKKTGSTQRIFLLPQALKIIKLMREHHRGEIIFPLPVLLVILIRLRRWAKEAGVREFTFHTARHTWASLNAVVNSMLYVKDGLGHSSIATTQIYSHLQLEQKIQGAKKFSDYLEQARRVYEESKSLDN
jgi:integrase